MASLIQSILITSLLLALLDIPWLLLIGTPYRNMIESIQGSPAQIRVIGAIPVYLALSYLNLQANSAAHAATLGIATYAVYDFTCLTLFKGYSTTIAIADTIWGGVLFYLAYLIRRGWRA
jgi:uncharacterized membrane protein